MKYDFLVLGAGISGMTTALILARHGYKVALIEKAKKIAPLLRGFYRRGIYFDTGFHYTGGLGDGEILDTYFRYLGISNQIEKVAFDPEGFDILRFIDHGKDFYFPYGYERIEHKLCDCFPSEKNAIKKYLKVVKEIYNSSPFLNLDREFSLESSYQLSDGPSLASFLADLTENRFLQYILSVHCLLYGVSPAETGLRKHALIVGSYYNSVHGLKGGGRSLARAFEAELGNSGVDIYCDSGVKKILFSSAGSLIGVELENKESLEAANCISTLHPQALVRIVPEQLFRPVYRKRLQTFEETPSAFIYFGLSAFPIKMLRKRSMFVCPDTTGTDFLKKTNSMMTRPMYITLCHNNQTDVCAVVMMMPGYAEELDKWRSTILKRRPDDYKLYKTQIMEDMKKYIVTNCPEFGEQIQYIDGATPLTLKDYTYTPSGSLYGIKHKIGQYNPMPMTKLKGLYLAGQAIVAPGILGAMVSAFLACGIILGHNHLRRELKKWR